MRAKNIPLFAARTPKDDQEEAVFALPFLLPPSPLHTLFELWRVSRERGSKKIHRGSVQVGQKQINDILSEK